MFFTEHVMNGMLPNFDEFTMSRTSLNFGRMQGFGASHPLNAHWSRTGENERQNSNWRHGWRERQREKRDSKLQRYNPHGPWKKPMQPTKGTGKSDGWRFFTSETSSIPPQRSSMPPEQMTTSQLMRRNAFHMGTGYSMSTSSK